MFSWRDKIEKKIKSFKVCLLIEKGTLRHFYGKMNKKKLNNHAK